MFFYHSYALHFFLSTSFKYVETLKSFNFSTVIVLYFVRLISNKLEFNYKEGKLFYVKLNIL